MYYVGSSSGIFSAIAVPTDPSRGAKQRPAPARPCLFRFAAAYGRWFATASTKYKPLARLTVLDCLSTSDALAVCVWRSAVVCLLPSPVLCFSTRIGLPCYMKQALKKPGPNICGGSKLNLSSSLHAMLLFL
jgi:hypothetical protein